MSAKMFKFSREAQEKVIAGVNTLANAVKVTLGPRGRNVVIQKQHGAPHITKDGVTVAKEVFLEDPFEDMGAQMVKQVASKTADVAGDGTTTATVLAQAIVNEGAKLVAAEHNPTDLKRGIDFAVGHVVNALQMMSKEITSKNEITQVGVISSNGDEEIGEMIATAMEEVGNEGVISLEEGKGIKTELSVVTGYQFDKGYLSQHFVTNEKLECVLENPLILMCDSDVSNVSLILPVLKTCDEKYPGRPLLLVALDAGGDALPTMVINHLKKSFLSCAVKAPGFGDRRKEMLSDMAVLTGGTVVSSDVGLKLENFASPEENVMVNSGSSGPPRGIKWLGSAKRVIVTKHSCTIIEGCGNPEDIESRVAEIRSAADAADGDWDRERQEERLAKLVGGVAVISVGASTETEMKEKKDRIEDALSATKAAVQEGIVPGGGIALLEAGNILNNVEIPEEFANGVNVVKKALKEPLYRIVANAGMEPVVVGMTIEDCNGLNFGYNARTNKYEDLVKAGVIDPTKVVRCALQNAASIASLVLTTECMIADKPKEEKPSQSRGGMPVM
jgi:chaperonin GroEL